MYDDILLFVKLFNSRRYSALAKNLNVVQSTISRRIKALEESMGFKLIEENVRDITLTSQGQILYEQFKDLEQKVQDLIAPLYETQKKIVGRLQIVLPIFLSHYAITPYLPEFIKKNPELSVAINFAYSSHNVNMKKESYDIALLEFSPKQLTQKVKLIYTDKIILVCSKEFLIKYKNCPTTPDKIEDYPIIGEVLFDQTIINHIKLYSELDDSIIKISNPDHLRINSFLEMLSIVRGGNVIAGIPESAIKNELLSGELIRVLPDFHCGFIKYYLIRNLDMDDLRYKKFEQFLNSCIKRLDTPVT